MLVQEYSPHEGTAVSGLAILCSFGIDEGTQVSVKEVLGKGEKRCLNAPHIHTVWEDRLKAAKHNPVLAVASYFSSNSKKGVKQRAVSQSSVYSVYLANTRKQKMGENLTKFPSISNEAKANTLPLGKERVPVLGCNEWALGYHPFGGTPVSISLSFEES